MTEWVFFDIYFRVICWCYRCIFFLVWCAFNVKGQYSFSMLYVIHRDWREWASSMNFGQNVAHRIWSRSASANNLMNLNNGIHIVRSAFFRSFSFLFRSFASTFMFDTRLSLWAGFRHYLLIVLHWLHEPQPAKTMTKYKTQSSKLGVNLKRNVNEKKKDVSFASACIFNLCHCRSFLPVVHGHRLWLSCIVFAFVFLSVYLKRRHRHYHHRHLLVRSALTFYCKLGNFSTIDWLQIHETLL